MTHVATLMQPTRLHGPQLVRACLPLPRGHRFDRAACPFELSLGGRPVPTQWELVSRYENGDAAVVEILGDGHSRQQMGATYYEVHQRATTAGAPPPPDTEIRGLLNVMSLRAFDVLGNEYRGDLGFPRTHHRRGPVCSTMKYATWLVPVGGSTTALPRLIAAIVWVTVEAGGRMVDVKMTVHSAPTKAPFPAKVYFRGLDLLVPTTWGLEYLWPCPAAGGVVEAGDLVAHQLIAPSLDGRPHVIEPRQRCEFRFALHQGEPTNARAYLDSGWGFAVPLPGPGLYSWANPACAGWGPSRVALHDPLDNPWAWPPSMTDAQGHDKTKIWGALATGARFSNVDTHGRLGPYHPASNWNGGMTGGDHIWQFEPFIVLGGRPDELLATMAHHRCITDRHHIGLYEDDGSVVNLAAYPGGWSIFSGNLEVGKEGPFKYSTADRAQETFVSSTGQVPSYEAALLQMTNIDCAHLTRRSSHSIALAWADNDPIARQEVQMLAEMAMGEWWHKKSTSQWLADGRLYDIAEHVAAHPKRGSGGLGRAMGWAMQVVAAAYQTGSDDYRLRTAAWLEMAIDVLVSAQMASGSWQAVTSGKVYDAVSPPNTPTAQKAAAAQAIEHGICNNGFASVVVSIAHRRPECLGALVDAASGLAQVWWMPQGAGPHSQIGTRPLDITKPSFATYQEMQAGTPVVSSIMDAYQIGSTLAYGLALDPTDTTIRAALASYCGAASFQDVVARLDAEGYRYYPDSRAPLFAIATGASWPSGS